MVSFARHSEERPGFDGVREQRSRWGGPTSSGEFDIGGVDGEVLRLRDGDGDGRERDDNAGLTHGEVCGAEWDVSNRFRRCNEGLANVAAGYGGRRSRSCAKTNFTEAGGLSTMHVLSWRERGCSGRVDGGWGDCDGGRGGGGREGRFEEGTKHPS